MKRSSHSPLRTRPTPILTDPRQSLILFQPHLLPDGDEVRGILGEARAFPANHGTDGVADKLRHSPKPWPRLLDSDLSLFALIRRRPGRNG